MVASKREKVAAIREFLDWLPSGVTITTNYGDGGGFNEDPDQLLAIFAEEVLMECDSAIAHGPGAQSNSPCIITGPHDEHYSDMGHEWSDSDITDKTYTTRGRKEPRTYRLAFDRYRSW